VWVVKSRGIVHGNVKGRIGGPIKTIVRSWQGRMGRRVRNVGRLVTSLFKLITFLYNFL
jgi:hypothetical protein